MPQMVLSNIIDESNLIDFSLFDIKDNDIVVVLKPVKYLEASANCINFIIRTEKYLPYAKLDVDGNPKIGYNLDVELDGNGLTESQAYSIFIDKLKIAERTMKKLLPVDELSQAQYDSLLSLYYRTGTFKTVGTEIRKFNIYDFIKQSKWNYVATALILSGNNRNIRQQEAKILMSGDYGKFKDRLSIKEESLKTLEREYPAGMKDNTSKFQAERVYFAETQRFLPGIDQARMKLIKNS